MANPEQLRLHRVSRHRGTVCGDNWLAPRKVVVVNVQPHDYLWFNRTYVVIA